MTLRGTENIWDPHQKQRWSDSRGEWGASRDCWSLPGLVSARVLSSERLSCHHFPSHEASPLAQLCAFDLFLVFACTFTAIWPSQPHCQEPPLLLRSKSSLCDWRWFWGDPKSVAAKPPQSGFSGPGHTQHPDLTSLGCFLAHSLSSPPWAAEQNS